MTQSYESLVRLYQSQGRLNPEALGYVWSWPKLEPPRSTLPPMQEFCIDVCADVNARIGGHIRAYGDLYIDGSTGPYLDATCANAVGVVASSWQVHGFQVPESAAAVAQDVAKSYAKRCMDLHWYNSKLNDAEFKKWVLRVGGTIGYSRTDLTTSYKDIVYCLKPTKWLSEGEIASAIRAALQ